ncbi:MAG: hypothetical protein K0R27_1818 [Xanthobacteraceae bacterium]|jgi:hypothetical protein|nr:hypothetical protein [Xanthobacteraceae bacterium]
MRKLVIAVLVLVVATLAGYFGVNAYAQNEAERQVTAVFGNLEAGGLKAGHGAVDFDLFARRLDVAGINLADTNGGGTTSIGRVTASGFSPPANGRVKAAKIEFSDIAFDGPSPFMAGMQTGYRIPLITIENYEGPERIAASSSEPWQLLLSFLESASAGSVSAPGFTITARTGTGEDATSSAFNYGPTRLSDIAGGKIAMMEIAASTFAITGKAPGTSAKGEIGRMTAKATDIGAMIALVDPERRAAATEFRTLYESIEAEGYKATFDNGLTQQWKQIALGKVAVRPAALPVDQLVAFSRRMQELQTKGEKAPPAETAAMLEALAGLYGAVELGAMRLDEMVLEQPGVTNATLKTLLIGGMKGGRIDTIAIEGFSGNDPSGKAVKLNRFVVNGLKPGELMQLGADAVINPAELNTTQHHLAVLRSLDGIEIEGIEAPIGPSPDDVVKLGTLQLSWGGFIGPVPSKMAASLRVSGPIAQLADDQPFSLMAASGATRADVAFDGGLNWSEADKTVTAAPLFVEIAGAFSASAKVTLTGVDKASFFSADEAEALNGALAANLGSLDITLTDAGIYEMKLKQVAKDQDATPEAVQQMTVGIAQIIAQQITSERPELERPAAAIVDFLSAPKGKLVLKITPKASLPLITVIQAANSDPVSLLDQVNIEATASR